MLNESKDFAVHLAIPKWHYALKKHSVLNAIISQDNTFKKNWKN